MLRTYCFALLIGISCLFTATEAAPLPLQFNESTAWSDELTTSYLSHTSDEHSSDEEHTGLHLASWNYEYVSIPLNISLFVLLTGLVTIIFHHIPHLSSYVPESCILIVIGTIMGAILYYAAGVPDSFRLESRTFMLFLLPPIVLEAAYSLNDRNFSDNVGTILLYAVMGTVINFLIIGFAMYGLDIAGAMGLPSNLSVSMLEFLLFASLIVAVDPVAVLAIFQDVGVHKTLYFLVFGESLLNDAVTIVLNNMMQAFLDTPTIDAEAICIGIGSFFTISLGALAIGVLFGIITSLLTKVTGHVRVIEPLLILVLAYLSYLCAELFHWSGIISLIGCGLVQAQYAHHNVSKNSHITIQYFIKMLSLTCESIVFLFLGLELVRTNHIWNTGFALWALFLCLVARVVSVFGLTFLVNLQSTHRKIKLEEQFIMWYGGLRGAIAFALCSTAHVSEDVKNMFLTTTFFIILFTVFGQGITIKPLVKYCKILMQQDESKDLLVELHGMVTDNLLSGLRHMMGQHGQTNLHTWVYKMNDKHLKRWFQKNPLTDREKFLDLYRQLSVQYYEAMLSNGTIPYAIPVTPAAIPISDFPFGMDLVNDKKEEELASEIKSELQAGKQTASKLHMSKGEMYRILSKASLARSTHFHDPYFVKHDITDAPALMITEEPVRSTFDVITPYLATPFGSMQQLNSADQTPLGSVGKLRRSPAFLTPTNSMLHLLPGRHPQFNSYTSMPGDDSSFRLKKATSVLSLREAQELMIVPNLKSNRSTKQKVNRNRVASKRSVSVTEPPAHVLFVPARSRKNSTTYDPSKRLTTLGEEQIEEVTTPGDNEYDEDQKEASEHGAYINRVMYDEVDEITETCKYDSITQSNHENQAKVLHELEDEEAGDFTSL